jgi:4'-phosphopantetheinyl transferase
MEAVPHACALRGEQVDRFLRRELPAAAPGVHLWWCDLQRRTDESDSSASLLSPAESARAERFGTDALKMRWIAGRAALRTVLGHTLGVAPAAVAIRRGTRGRPELADTGSGIDFNVSHTRGVALIAIARGLAEGTRIGVDIEHRDREIGADRLARKFLTPREQATLADLAPDLRRQRFLRHWTCKEAMSKATGDGIAAPFGRLDVEIAQPPRLVDGPPPYLPGHWSLSYAEVPDEWLVTVAIWRGAR